MTDKKTGYLLPEQLVDHDLLCLSMKIPNDELYRAAITGAIYTLNQWYNWQRTGDNSGSIAASYWRELIFNTLEITECDNDGFSDNSASYSSAVGGDGLERLIKLLMENDVKYRINGELYEVALDLVPCGCGSGTEGANTALGSLPGATPPYEGLYGSVVTLCDVITTGIPYLLSRVDDMIGEIQNGTFFLDIIDFTDSLPFASGWLDDVRENANLITDQLTDNTFIGKIQDIFARTLNDPFNTPFDRQMLRGIARRVPFVSEGAPMQATFYLWSEVANLREINAAMPGWAGTGDATLCAGVGARNGRPLYSAPNTAPFGPTIAEQFDVVASVYTYTTVIVSYNEAWRQFSVNPFTPPEFAGVGENIVGNGWILTNCNLTSGVPGGTVNIDNSESQIAVDNVAPNYPPIGGNRHARAYNLSGIPAPQLQQIYETVQSRTGNITVDNDSSQTQGLAFIDTNIQLGAVTLPSGNTATLAYWYFTYRTQN